MRSLVPRDEIVFSHNDAQENNILSSLSDATNIVLIDYEYGFWNPKYYDLGNYINEFICDNAYPVDPPGIHYWMENWPTESEIEALVREYFILEKSDEWDLEKPECQKAL